MLTLKIYCYLFAYGDGGGGKVCECFLVLIRGTHFQMFTNLILFLFSRLRYNILFPFSFSVFIGYLC